MPAVLVMCDMLDDHCYMICGNACVCIRRCDLWKRRAVNKHHQQSCTYVVEGRVGLNTGYITGADMCKECTEAVQSVAL